MVNKFLRQVAGGIALAAVSVFSQAPMDSSLTAYWPFEESSLFSTNDESFNHYDLLGVQGVINAHVVPNGPYGSYLNFDSIGCKTVARESMGKFNAPNFTFAAFVQLQGPSKLETIFQSSAGVAGNKAGYQIQIAPDNTILVVFGDSVSGSWKTIVTSAKVMGVSHVAVTFDGANVRAYINGSLVGSYSASGPFTPGTGSAVFGGSLIDGQYSNLFKDKIDEIRVYNRVLTGAEIAALASPKIDVTGCWNVEQDGPDKVYTGTMSLTENTMSGTVSGSVTWNSPYPTTAVSGTVNGNGFSVTGSWTTPSAVTVTYSGELTAYGERIVNGVSKDNGNGQYGFKAIKKVCVAQDTVSLCYTTHQEKSPGSGTWWTGTMNMQVLTDGTVIGGTIVWDVPSHAVITGGSISGPIATIIANVIEYGPATYTGTFTADSNIINGLSNGTYAFNAAKISCTPPPPATTTQCWSVRQEKSPGSNTWWTGMLQIVINADGTISAGTINWDVPSSGTVTGGSVSGNSISVSTHNITYNMDVTYTGTLSADGNSIVNGLSGGTYAFDGTKAVCP